KGLRIGYVPEWMKEAPATDVDRAALDTAAKLGMVPTAVTFPNWPVDSLNVQTADAWPNLFRSARFLSAVDFVQTDRLRRKLAQEMDRIMSGVDVLLVPTLRDETLTTTNFTGQPSLTMRAGFVQ